MSATLIDGRQLAQDLEQGIRQRIQQRQQQGLTAPGLAVILVGQDPASVIYVSNKAKACGRVGIRYFDYSLTDQVSEQQLTELIAELNQNPSVDGILLQLPLPDHLDASKLLEQIAPAKDVDGFHPYNLGRLAQRLPGLRPATPKGVMTLLANLPIELNGLNAVVVGASNIVGRPMALELLLAGCTVVICHRFTQDLAGWVKQADILVSAVGRPELIKGAWIKPGAAVIDVGTARTAAGKLVGDIEFAPAQQRAGWITPVPGGVGPMTIVSLLENTLTAAEIRHH